MENFPLQLILFGFANRIVEPFCYGCAGFVLSYRLARTVPAKLFFISLTILFFLWMDDIWLGLSSRSARLAMASENSTVAEAFADRQLELVGRAEYDTGGRTGLWDIVQLDAWDIGSAVMFVPLAFYVGLRLTRRRLDEHTAVQNPPSPPGSGSQPPPPPNWKL